MSMGSLRSVSDQDRPTWHDTASIRRFWVSPQVTWGVVAFRWRYVRNAKKCLTGVWVLGIIAVIAYRFWDYWITLV